MMHKRLFSAFTTFALVLLLAFLLAPSGAYAEESANAEQAQAEAQAKQDQAEAQAKQDQAEALGKQIQQDIYDACIKDLNSPDCSCDKVPEDAGPEAKAQCEETLVKALKDAKQKKSAIESACMKDPYSKECSCDGVPPETRSKCEAGLSRGLKEAKEKKAEIEAACRSDISKCDCSAVPESSRQECEEKKQGAEKQKNEVAERCRRSPGTCNCDELAEGGDECRKERDAMNDKYKAATTQVFDECFNNVMNCDCSGLFDKYFKSIDSRQTFDDSIAYCVEQRNYGLNCMRAGLDCDQMDAEKMIPAEVPDFLKPFVKQSLKSKIENEKKKGLAEAAKIITSCIEGPENCDCSKTPTYAQEFCEHKKELQIQCNNDDYTACEEIDSEPIVPDYMPEFSRGIITRLVEKLKDAQKSMTMARASRKVGNSIMKCMDGPDQCDCSMAPKGKFRAFCEHKKSLIGKCMADKDINACFTLDSEPMMPEGVPKIIMSYVEKSVLPVMESKKQAMYEQMKGSHCEGLTIRECKEYCEKNECVM